MPGPWDKYAEPAATPSGPWEKYSAPPPDAPAETPSLKAAPSSDPSKEDLDAFMKARYSGPNHARNIRQKNDDAGLTPIQIWKRSQALQKVAGSMPGVQDVTNAVQQTGQGEYKKALHSAIVGTGKAAAIPFGAPALALAPVATATAIGTGMVATPLARSGAKLAGADDDTADLVGDAAGIASGYAAGKVPEIGAGVRAGAGAVARKAPFVGKWIDGIWQEAKAGYYNAKPAAPSPTAPKTAPTTPEATPAAATAGPKPAPAGGLSKAALDEAAVSLGHKSFDGVPEGQKALVRSIATQKAALESQPAAAPQVSKYTPAPPKPAPTEAAPPAAPAETPQTGPKTVREMLDKELEDNRAAAAPAAAPAAPAVPKVDAAHIARATAAELLKRGVKLDDLLAMTDAQRKAVMGPDAEHFPEIVREMRSQVAGGKMDTARGSKDEAMARFFQAKGITPDQVAAMDEGTLATHIKSAGYRPPGKSGALGRSHTQVQHDIVNEMTKAGATPNSPAGSAASNPPASNAPTDAPAPSSPSNEGTKAEQAPSKGVSAIVRTPNQTQAKVRYNISEAKDLKTSFDPDYNSEIGHQPRDTTRIGSEQRVAQRMSDMDPDAMGPSRMAGDGAPITNQGHAVTRNHGLEALKRLYGNNSPRAQQYKDWATEQAGLAGKTPEEVGKMDQPVLHRELTEDWDHPKIKQFADEANMSSTARMSDAELASQMGDKLKGASMDSFKPNDEGVPNPEFVRGVIKDLPPEEQAQFFQRSGEISQTGARLIRNAVFAKAYNNVGAIERMAESTDSQVRNITNGMLKSAAPQAKLQESIARGDSYPLSIGDEVGKAVEVIDHLRTSKKSVADWLKQTDLLGRDPVVHSLVDILAGESRRPNMIRDTLNNYVESVVRLGSPKQKGIFGDSAPPSKLELLEDAHARARAKAESGSKDDGQTSLLGPDAGGSSASPSAGTPSH